MLCSIGRLYGKILTFRLEMNLVDVGEQSGFRADARVLIIFLVSD